MFKALRAKASYSYSTVLNFFSKLKLANGVCGSFGSVKSRTSSSSFAVTRNEECLHSGNT